MNIPGDHLSMPQELIEAAAGLSVQKEDVVKKLVEAMASIAAVAADVESNLRQIREYLEVNMPFWLVIITYYRNVFKCIGK